MYVGHVEKAGKDLKTKSTRYGTENNVRTQLLVKLVFNVDDVYKCPYLDS